MDNFVLQTYFVVPFLSVVASFVEFYSIHKRENILQGERKPAKPAT